MEHAQHDLFIHAINEKKKAEIVYESFKDNNITRRTVAPMDFGPKAKEKIHTDRYHVWDYDSPSGPHTSSLTAGQIRSIIILEENFDPADFVTWAPNWHISRDWGRLS